VYAAAYGCELLAADVAGITLCLRIEYLGISFLPPLYILTVTEMYAREKTRMRAGATALFAVSISTLLIHFTNGHHHLFYASVGIDSSGPFPVAALAEGPWYWIHIAYVNIAQLYCNVLLLKMLAGSQSRERGQAAIMLAGSFIPWAGLVAYLLGFSPWGIDINPFTLSVTGLILAWGLFSRKIIDLTPVAYDALFRHLPDGVVVLDDAGRVTDINPAACRMTGFDGAVVGLPAREVLPLPPDDACEDDVINDCQMHMVEGTSPEKYLDLRATPLLESSGRTIGRLLTMRDITETRKLEMTIRTSEKRLRAEIARVRNIQAAMLPDFSRAGGYDIASAFLPAEELSGDFIDGFPDGDSAYQVIICDVMHHGMASAYIGMEIRSLFRALSVNCPGPGCLIGDVNAKLTEDFAAIAYFATVAVCRLDLAAGKLLYSSGGHPPSLIHSEGSGAIRETDFTGPLIGLRKDNRYAELEISLEPGDSLLLYTDGVTESRSHVGGKMYGRESLAAEFRKNAGTTSKETIHSIIAGLFEYTDYAPLEDDISIICIKRSK
ncbi:MAG: SpoIIE family protein phosphatase, partial [Spirochaetes bacterium]|nr:SpoIIE family protein phosphatase [Spirochaetota bacterium]